MKPQNKQVKERKVAGFFENIFKNLGTIGLGALLFALIFIGYYLINDKAQERIVKYAASVSFSISYEDRDSDRVSLDAAKEVMESKNVKELVYTDISTDESYNRFIDKATMSYDNGTFTISYFDNDETYARTVVKSLFSAVSVELMDNFKISNISYTDELNPIVYKVQVKTGGFVNNLGIKGFTLLGICVGIIFSLVAVCAFYLLDNTVKNAMDVRRYYDLPVLAVIPTVKDKDE